ncbi:unnamed protein product [Durusdinium trenchii]|uniref:Uncharacterized protein n=2 Tax=Durusdinium trenchii TaxID=1381693 RepID=A0ABP0LWD7_9DINO
MGYVGAELKEDASVVELELLRSVMCGVAEPAESSGRSSASSAFGFRRDRRALCAALHAADPALAPPPQATPDIGMAELARDYVQHLRTQQGAVPSAWRGLNWTVPLRRFKDKDRQILSPSFVVRLDDEPADFKVILRSEKDSSFARSGGKGFVEVKLVSEIPSWSRLRLQLTLGGLPCAVQDHDFSVGVVARFGEGGCKERPKIFNFTEALTDLVVVLEVMPVPAASEMPKKPQSIFL